jgi:hypothetical protein
MGRFLERQQSAPRPSRSAMSPIILSLSSMRCSARKCPAHWAETSLARPLIAHCHLGLGKLYRRTDKREWAREHLATAMAMYRDIGMTYWLEKAEAERTELA